MQHQPINCEASVKIYNKKDCAFHARLGWSKTEWHTHRKGQLIYAEHGIMRLHLREKTRYIPSLHAAWIPTGVEHLVATVSVNIIFRSLYLEYDYLKDTFYDTVSVFYISALLREMLLYTERFNLDDIASNHEVSFLEAVKQLLPAQCPTKIDLHLPTPSLPVLQQIAQYLENNLHQPVSMPDVARKLGVSDRSLSRMFKLDMRMSFVQYLKLLRMVKAVELLVLPGKNVSEVALAVGYESLPTFSNNFYEIMGTRPNMFLHH
ncbi:MAG: helix-turn-helix transcriptional regulator [Bacteroidetes bacterium]|nr:helix-turn-helix transcriptional regulator [Bacteroidota bacterium]